VRRLLKAVLIAAVSGFLLGQVWSYINREPHWHPMDAD